MTKNEELQGLIAELKKAAIENKVKLWKRIAEDLEKPTRQRRAVNVYKLSQHASKDEVLVVPGKVLGNGELDGKVEVAAQSFSEEALKKIKSKGKALSLKELVKNNPKGKKVRIIG